MFCKKCGHQNLEGAKFCMSCGSGMPLIQEAKTSTANTKIKDEFPITLRNKPNAFQKIGLLVSLTLFVFAFFYIPYKANRGIIYDVLWSDRAERVDLFIVFIQFSFLFVITYSVYRYLSRFNALEKTQYKKLAKRELYLFFFLVFCLIICGLYLCGINYINKTRNENLTESIAQFDRQIKQNSEKRNLRLLFWETVKTETLYDLSEFNNSINQYWDFLLINLDNEDWLNEYYSNLSEWKVYYHPEKRKLYGKYELRRLGYFQDEIDRAVANGSLKREPSISNTRVLEKKFGIHSSNDLRKFIQTNALIEEDLKKDAENVALSKKLNKLREKKAQLTLYSNKDFRRIGVTFYIIVFASLYVLRPLFWYVKGLFAEIN